MTSGVKIIPEIGRQNRIKSVLKNIIRFKF